MRADEIMLTEEERRSLRAKRKRRLLIAATVVLLIIAAFFTARPASRGLKGWQARRHARAGFALMEEAKWNDARTEVTAAYQLRSTEPEALRAVARFLSRTRQPQALEFWDQLAKLTPLTRTDLRDEASIALLAGDDSRASSAIEQLNGKRGAIEPVDQLLAAQLAIRRGAPADAHTANEKVANDPRANSREKLQAALLQLGIAGSEAEWRAEASAWLQTIAKGNDDAALDALTVLAQTLLAAKETPEHFPLDAPELARAIVQHPLARAPQKLLATDLLIREQPEQREELMNKAIAQWKDAEAPDAAALATWLNGKGEFQRTLDTFPADRALQSRDLLLQYVDAQGGLGRWTEIKQLLENDRFPLDPVVQKMYLARCNAQLGEKMASENNWQRALEAAGGDATKLMTVANYAEKNGALDVAAAAYDTSVAEAPKLRAAHQGRLRIAQFRRDTKQIHATLADMLKLWPNDSAVQNDEAYTRLLSMAENAATTSQQPQIGDEKDVLTSRDELTAITSIAEQLVGKEPSSLPHRTLLALARLKAGRAAEALAVYEKLQVPQQALTPSALAVHAAVLAANGNSADARTEAKQIPPDALLPEEARLVESLR